MSNEQEILRMIRDLSETVSTNVDIVSRLTKEITVMKQENHKKDKEIQRLRRDINNLKRR